MTIVAGRLRRRVIFQEAVLIRDPDGMLIQGWEDRFTCWCHVLYLRGSEAVMQARLVLKAPAILTIRASAATRAITSEWRVVIAGVVFDLKEDPRPSEDGAFLEMPAEA